jgi:hypothetical protein
MYYMYYKILFICLIIIFIFIYLKTYYINKTTLSYQLLSKPTLWIYWDDLQPRPGYIELCLSTIYKNSYDFNLYLLNKDNILDYLPEIKSYEIYFNDLLLAQKVDIYRIWLMYKYGGLYIDTDTILLKSPIKLYNLLNKYDYIGYGCTGDICFPKDAYGYPSNGIIFSRPNTLLMKNILNSCLQKIMTNNKKINYSNPDTYYDLGKVIIWEELTNIIKLTKYKYYHIDKEIGIRDENGKWVTPNRMFSNENYKFYGESKRKSQRESELVMIPLYNNMMKDYRKYSKDDILNLNYNISKYFKKALDIHQT